MMQSKLSILLNTIFVSSTLFPVFYGVRQVYWQSIHLFFIFTNIYLYDQDREQEIEYCLVWIKCDMGFISPDEDQR